MRENLCFQERLYISFSRCSSLDIGLFTSVFSCSLSRSSGRILPVLVSSLTFLRVFPDSLYAFYFLLFSIGKPYSVYFGVPFNFLARFSRLALRLLLLVFFGRFVSFFQPIFSQNPVSKNLNYNNFLPLTKH